MNVIISHDSQARENVLDIRGLTVRYERGAPVLHDLSLSIFESEVYVLLGESGSGKTTLLNSILGLVVPEDSSSIRLYGSEIAGGPPGNRGVGIVFQDHGLFPFMSVSENIAFPSLASGLSFRLDKEHRRKLAEVLELVDLISHRDKAPQELSGGQKRRVALARAIVGKPKLLCLDEPFSGLDPPLKRELEQSIERVRKCLGQTILHITHDQEEAMRLGHRIGILHKGKIVQSGKPQDLYRLPRSLYVASFLGECNVLKLARVEMGKAITESGTSFTFSGIGSLKPGECIGCRPENIKWGTTKSDSALRFKATLEDTCFLGREFRLGLRLSGGELLNARCPVDEPKPARGARESFYCLERHLFYFNKKGNAK